MKKIISLFLLFASAVFVSCDDFLTVESPDKITSDSFWRNATDAEAGLAAAYSQLECSTDTWAFAEVKWPVEAYREDMIL
ncbi:MAG TPA: RagB/SusD family nutrient uptake outer membrane protein, partial [Porphyromonadaceae bacterium]|nr:RagB/SusD family nutrient uptake outer membrane protein [Porphyromonadaceae bacterium]